MWLGIDHFRLTESPLLSTTPSTQNVLNCVYLAFAGGISTQCQIRSPMQKSNVLRHCDMSSQATCTAYPLPSGLLVEAMNALHALVLILMGHYSNTLHTRCAVTLASISSVCQIPSGISICIFERLRRRRSTC